MQYQFNAAQVNPAQTVTCPPLDWYMVIIAGEDVKENKEKSNIQLGFQIRVVDGPHKGSGVRDGMNLQNPNETTVRIAQQRLSAYAHVVGRLSFNDTRELHNLPFYAQLGPQKDDPKYGEIFAMRDLAGNEPGKQAQPSMPAPTQAQQQQPPANFGMQPTAPFGNPLQPQGQQNGFAPSAAAAPPAQVAGPFQGAPGNGAFGTNPATGASTAATASPSNWSQPPAQDKPAWMK